MKKARKSKVGLFVALVAALSCSSMVAVSQLCFKESNGVITASAETTSGVAAQSMTSAEIAEAWASAVQQSVANSEQVTFTLEDNWTALSDDTYTTSFGTDAEDATVSAFSNGRIYVPVGADIVLDLKGYTIDRGLTGDDATAVADGSVIYVEGSLEITDTSEDDDDGGVINYGVITGGNNTQNGGGIVIGKNGSVTLSEGVISENNSTASWGGGVFLSGASASFTMDGGLITKNTTNYGSGGIGGTASEVTVTINDGEISENTVPSEGGGVNVQGTFIMNGGKIINNTCTKSDSMGGGVRMAFNSSFTMNGGEISGNTAGYGGGARLHQTTAVMNGGKISDNTSSNNGGGVYVDGGKGSFTLNDGEISGNTSTGARGGGINVQGGSTFEMNGGKISGNSIASYGAGLHGEGATLIINNGEISNNTTAGSGGGVCAVNGRLTVNGGTIKENTTTGRGAGIFSFGSTVISIIGGEISGNTATANDGGGLYITNSTTGAAPTVTMTGGTFTNNTTAWAGGGVYVASGVFTLNGGKIIDNTANSTGYGGGGVYVSGGTLNVNSGVISGNTATNGGGLYKIGGTVNMNGGTITGNHSTAWGGGVYINSSNFNVSGGVIFGNTKSDGTVNNVQFSGSTYYLNVAGRLSSDTYIGIYNTAARTVTSGYSSNGNKAGKEGNYFVSDNASFEISNNGTEVTLVAATTTPAARTDFDWSYKAYDANYENPQSVTVDAGALSATATYTGGAFVFNASNIAITDDNGKAVSSIVKAGNYHLSVPNADKAKYNNPVFNFTVIPADVSELDLNVKADSVVYTGSALTTSVKVFNGTALLEENKDYTLTFSNNTNAGTGKITVTAMGNYRGTFESTFTIEKAKLSVRWGLDTKTYTGSSLDMDVYTEGVLTNTTITPTRTYTNVATGATGTPEDVGDYIVKLSLDNANYELDRTYEHEFHVTPKKVDVVWGEVSFTYGGDAKTVIAQYKNGSDTYDLTVSYLDKDGNPVDEAINVGTYTAVAAEPENTNFVLTSGTKQITFTIEKAEVAATWPSEMPSYKYDGNAKEISGITVTGLNSEDLSAGLSYTYYDEHGNELTDNGGKPVDAGTYKVVISFTNANYVLSGKTEDTFTITKQQLVLTLDKNFDGEYDGSEKSPLTGATVNGVELEGYTVTYALIDDSGNVLENLGETKPTNVGKYRLTVTASEEDAANIANPTATAEFAITEKEAQIEWVFGDLAVEINGVYTYLYDGTAHQPKAYLVDSEGNRIQANGEDIELTVTGTGKSVGNGYTSVAESSNSNYVLSGDTEVTFNVIKSKVASVRWYEYGKTEPLAAGVKPSYEYIFVYGQEEGAKLSAYGVLTAADENITWESTKCQVKLNVTYSTYYEGYWKIGTYTATASLSSTDGLKDSCYMPLGINDKLEFEVTAITHSAEVAKILWVVVSEDAEGNVKHTVVNANTKFVYNGELQAPQAILLLGNNYNPDYPEANTYKFITVKGAATEAGTYYAYIVPDETLKDYEIKAEDSECKFVISPEEINIAWEGINDEGVIEVTYTSQEQAPKAYLVDENGDEILVDGNRVYLAVDGYTDAGTYQVTATTDANHKIKNGDPVKFVIKQYEIKTSDIVWAFAENDNGTAKGGEEGIEKYFEWQYDGNPHAPVASLKVTLVEGENPVEVTVKLSLTGSATTAGTHYAYATLDSTDYANANFKMEVAKLRLEIVQNAVTVVWDDADEDGAINFTYDGKAHTPKAHYINAEGNRVELHVIGEGTDAGKYVALITNDIGSNDVRKVFTINAKEIAAKWNEETLKYDYNGSLRTPSVSFIETELDEDGNEVTVALVLGKDYTVSGFINAGSYTSEITMLNGNYKVAVDATKPFVISKRAVTLTWYGVDGYDEETGEGDTKNFVWAFDGQSHAPTVRANVEGLDITVIGAENSVGNYTAIAILNSENYVISASSSAECKFSIVGSAIYIIWIGEDGSTEDFEWEYDGKDHAPKAYWAEKDENGEFQFVLDEEENKIELQVIGVGIYAGTYTAKAILPDSNCDWADGISGKCEFTVTKKVVAGIVWVGYEVNEDGEITEKFTWEYDGEYHAPKAYIVDEDGNKGEELTVLGKEVNACVGEEVYTATAILANSENYEFAEGVETAKEFTITAKKVLVKWTGNVVENEDGTTTETFTWEYDKKVHCPTASFVDVKGNTVQIPVIGGTASGGPHVAKLLEVFDNYEFTKASLERTFTITQMSVTVEWADDTDHKTVDETSGAITYTYTYNGSTQMPAVTAKHGGESVTLSYLIKLNNKAVNAIIGAGTYEVTVSPADNNYNITKGATTVTVIVEALEVEVKWANVNDDNKVVLTYNGTAQAPEAYFEYTVENADGNEETVRVTLTVEGAKIEVSAEGETYTATAILPSDNFKLKEGTTDTVAFEIVPNPADEYEWDWETNGWKVVDKSTTEKPVTPPEGGEVEGGEGGDGEDESNSNTGSEGEDETEGTTEGSQGTDETVTENGTTEEGEDEGDDNTTLTETENLSIDPADGENLTTDPNEGNRDENEGDDEDGEGNN